MHKHERQRILKEYAPKRFKLEKERESLAYVKDARRGQIKPPRLSWKSWLEHTAKDD
jgi:hypothetical protein